MTGIPGHGKSTLVSAIAMKRAGGTTGGGIERFRGALQLADLAFKDAIFVFMPMDHFRAQGYHTLGTGKIMHNRDRKEWQP